MQQRKRCNSEQVGVSSEKPTLPLQLLHRGAQLSGREAVHVQRQCNRS
jgi:hypothetical protein